ncbi:MAG: hypothetical protein KJO54_11615 [Gammaproteobacteria bacterium]|nr:hypothetical protein [Gammaproteobacteria bacterium]NNF62087.1 hypothetical protein [Gammaproteobacteria bacterium]NNM20471.1 hypothetical protein [Gammaproteobacteria bacterium]
MPADELILAIDQGGGSTRAVTFTTEGTQVFLARVAVATQRGPDGRVEHDASEVLNSMHRVIVDALRDAESRGAVITGAGLATQRSSIVCWDRNSGVALTPVISWQDRRAAKLLAEYAPPDDTVSEITGLVRSPHYGASKMRWCIDNIPAVRQAQRSGTLMIGPLSSFLLFHLLQQHPACADPANASRTLLWDRRSLDWSDELLAAFGISRGLLPRCVPSQHEFGVLRSTAVPLRVCTGDQNAAIFAGGAIAQGTAYVNIGTGAFVLAQVAGMSAAPLLHSVAWSDGSSVLYVQEGTVNGAGAALASLGATQPEIATAARQIGADELPLFLNGVSGLGSPFWREHFTSRFIGSGSQRQKLAAVVESILFLLQKNIEILQQRTTLDVALVSGGLAGHDDLCQALADLSGLAVMRPDEAEATARGLAFLSAGQPGGWPAGKRQQFCPRNNHTLRRRYDEWSREMTMALDGTAAQVDNQ